jgi:hypothetical protein
MPINLLSAGIARSELRLWLVLSRCGSSLEGNTSNIGGRPGRSGRSGRSRAAPVQAGTPCASCPGAPESRPGTNAETQKTDVQPRRGRKRSESGKRAVRLDFPPAILVKSARMARRTASVWSAASVRIIQGGCAPMGTDHAQEWLRLRGQARGSASDMRLFADARSREQGRETAYFLSPHPLKMPPVPWLAAMPHDAYPGMDTVAVNSFTQGSPRRFGVRDTRERE